MEGARFRQHNGCGFATIAGAARAGDSVDPHVVVRKQREPHISLCFSLWLKSYDEARGACRACGTNSELPERSIFERVEGKALLFWGARLEPATKRVELTLEPCEVIAGREVGTLQRRLNRGHDCTLERIELSVG